MSKKTKLEMRNRANVVRGLARVFLDDADYILTDVNDRDWMALNESLTEARHTLERMADNLTELEYMLYLLKQNN